MYNKLIIHFYYIDIGIKISEIDYNIIILIQITLLANLYNSLAGSVPTDKINISGVFGEESLYISVKSDDCGSKKCAPRLSIKKSCNPFNTLSGLKHLRIINDWKWSKTLFQGSGNISLKIIMICNKYNEIDYNTLNDNL